MEAVSSEKTTEKKPPFMPKAPGKIQDLDISDSLVEDLVLRRLYTTGTGSIRALSKDLKLSFSVIQSVFEHKRKEQLFEVKGMEEQDYTFVLSGKGQEFASKRFDICRYSGPAPVSLKSYREAVRAQTSEVKLNRSTLQKTFSDLVLTPGFLDQLGPALVSQNSIFLYGPTGNGKTSIVTRMARIYQDAVLIPYALEVDRQIIVLYDPVFHEGLKREISGLDPRWVLCRRPFVLVGGELEPSMLELKMDQAAGVYAAPLQMKANNGVLVIDDFGRQILSPQFLLNRWIVPLDRRVDYLNLSYGLKFEIPFEMMVIFSTNIEPHQLADEAFLRRIQNKIYVGPVGPKVFDQIFNRILKGKKFDSEPGNAEVLRKICQQIAGPELRACYPADIISIIESISTYEEAPIKFDEENLKRATNIYFTKTMDVLRNKGKESWVGGEQEN
jgi:hypothetical protein